MGDSNFNDDMKERIDEVKRSKQIFFRSKNSLDRAAGW